MQDSAYSVLATRVILNIRDAGRRNPMDSMSELHFTDEEIPHLECFNDQSKREHSSNCGQDLDGEEIVSVVWRIFYLALYLNTKPLDFKYKYGLYMAIEQMAANWVMYA